MLLLDLLLHGPLRTVDLQVHHRTTPVQPGWPTDLASVAAAAGHWSVQGGALLLIAVLVAVRHRTLAPVVTSAVGLVLLAAVGTVLKEVLGRTGPQAGVDHLFAGSSAFPSGHAAGAVVVGVLGAQLAGRSRWFLAAGVGWALLVGWSRVQIAVHWSTDVLAGWLLGMVVLALTGLLLDLVRHPSAAGSCGRCDAGLEKFLAVRGSDPAPDRTSGTCSAAPIPRAPGRSRTRAPGPGDPR